MIYVLVPAHNEAPTVGLLLWKVRQLFTSFNREYQLIVVNDGSTDATDEVLSPYTRALPLTLITHKTRQGYARSLEALFREAVKRTDRPRRDVALTIQADFSESPDDLLELIKKLEGGADIVVADRRKRVGAGFAERFARTSLAGSVRKKLGLAGAEDVVGTMRGYRLVALERLVNEAGSGPILSRDGWAADVELLARTARFARTIESVEVAGERPISARPSRIQPLREAWSAFRASGAMKQFAKGPAAPADDRRTDESAHPRPERQRNEPRSEPRRERPAQHRHERRPPAPRKEPAAAQNQVQNQNQNQSPAAASEEGSQKRRRRRRGRGRGRRGGQGPQGPQQTSNPSSAPPPAA